MEYNKIKKIEYCPDCRNKLFICANYTDQCSGKYKGDCNPNDQCGEYVSTICKICGGIEDE